MIAIIIVHSNRSIHSAYVLLHTYGKSRKQLLLIHLFLEFQSVRREGAIRTTNTMQQSTDGAFLPGKRNKYTYK